MKNKMMRLASLLMVAVLLTTSVVSGTYAKYVTSDEATATARVAKWGVTVVASGDDTMFSKEYAEADDKTVLSSTVDKVVAPGTKNETGITFTITGTPEVDAKVTVDMTAVKDVFLKAGNVYADTTTGDDTDTFTFTGTNYYPVQFKLTKDGTEVAKGNLEAIATYLNDDARDVTYQVEASPVKPLNTTYKLTWEWVFPVDADSSVYTPEEKLIDQQDTLLGNLAADPDLAAKQDGTSFAKLVAETDYRTNLAFNIKITVTQID